MESLGHKDRRGFGRGRSRWIASWKPKSMLEPVLAPVWSCRSTRSNDSEKKKRRRRRWRGTRRRSRRQRWSRWRGKKGGRKLAQTTPASRAAAFPPKRNLKVGIAHWLRHPLLLMKLPPRAHTFNFPPRVQPSRKPISHPFPQPATNHRLLFRRSASRLSEKRPALLFLVTSDTNAGFPANKALCFFLSLPRTLSTAIPPMSPFALCPFVVPTYRQRCWFDVRYSISIKRVDQLRYCERVARLPSSLTRKSMVMPALALKRTVQAARERWFYQINSRTGNAN